MPRCVKDALIMLPPFWRSMMIDVYRGEAGHGGRLSIEEEKGIRRLKRRKVKIMGERV